MLYMEKILIPPPLQGRGVIRKWNSVLLNGARDASPPL